MKKLWLSKNQKALVAANAKDTNVNRTTVAAGTIATPTILHQINKVIKNPTPTYIQRKSMEPRFQELFSALFKIPDKEIQERVLAAINGHCRQCKERKERIYVTTGTQTDISNNSDPIGATTISTYSEISNKLKEDTAEAAAESCTTETTLPKRRKRKRKICLPRVVKQSHADLMKQQQHQYTTQMKKLKIQKPEEKNERELSTPPIDIARSPKIDDSLLDNYEHLVKDNNTNINHIIEVMEDEFKISSVWVDGYLPIHNAIMSNDELKLQRQIYVFKMKQVDLNDLITEDDNDCLQLAVLHDCLPGIFQILLTNQLVMNTTDEQSNNIIHLAMTNEIQLGSLEILLENIGLEMLLQINDDGYTPLHLAVRKDLFQHVELLLNTLDNRLANKLVYPRKQSEECRKQEFYNYYENACNELETDALVPRSELKGKILNAVDMRGGNTALLYCIENKLDHLAFLLLAHLADPRIINYSNQSAKLYFNEFGKLFDLSLKVDKIMDKVVELLQ